MVAMKNGNELKELERMRPSPHTCHMYLVGNTAGTVHNVTQIHGDQTHETASEEPQCFVSLA